MGRPLQPPTIKPLYRPDGTVRGYLVSATVGGKQRKKIRRTMDQAKDLAAKWQGCRDESIQHLPTTLTIPKLRDAEAADAFWESLGLTATEAAAWMVQHYKKPADGTWNVLIEEFRQARRVKHRLKEDAPDTPHLVNLFAAARGFAAHTGRPNVGNPTQDEVESFMKTRGGFNQLLGDLRSLCIWAVKRGRMPVDPTLAIERQMRVRGKIPTILRPEQVAHILHTLEVEAPEWIPYAAVCIFAYVRPYTREGEAQRMDADLREGRQVVLKDGLFVSLSKNGKPRVIPWHLTGPLREWITVYPPNGGLYPPDVDSPAKAERAWKVWRRRFDLPKDVMRHTGLTAAFFSGADEGELNMSADNSHYIRKRDYLGQWCKEDTEQMWAIKPKFFVVNRPPVETSPSRLTAYPMSRNTSW